MLVLLLLLLLLVLLLVVVCGGDICAFLLCSVCFRAAAAGAPALPWRWMLANN
jgi:hypothetical protein